MRCCAAPAKDDGGPDIAVAEKEAGGPEPEFEIDFDLNETTDLSKETTDLSAEITDPSTEKPDLSTPTPGSASRNGWRMTRRTQISKLCFYKRLGEFEVGTQVIASSTRISRSPAEAARFCIMRN